MNEIKTFNNDEFGQVRTIIINNDIWFVAKDISESLGYSKVGNMTKLIDSEDKKVISSSILEQQIGETEYNQSYQVTIINESGLYASIFGSKQENAKQFKHWITSTVLPSIRKNGGYISGQETMTNEQIIANALIVANKVIEEKNKQIEVMQPKSDYFDRLVDSRLLTTFRDCAKEFNMKPKAFTDWLRENGYIYNDKHNIIKPYQQYVKGGLFSMKDFNTPYGYSNVQTYITVKGKETFRLLLGLC